ncbi:Sodium/calcium exchanger protein-domain-containing protein [Aspergillus avenaceus]|uniref:Vacuolar calcium ion transporter n=1 Tax=Aspergillus avenaceus TaxID=36643 RepID=A0A5N6THR6_ASPAV|nr:Sodium/calcium exchanger protein-domain-containing protein [Aspergillus avenaceus]
MYTDLCTAPKNFRSIFRSHTWGSRRTMTGLSRNSSDEPTERDALINGPNRANSGLKHRTWSYWPLRVVHLTWATIIRDYVNVLLIFVPLGIIAGALHWDSTAVFTLNFLAIVPLASLLSFATEELAEAMGQALGGLMNATFGNAVELIVSIIALKNGQIRVVQASMLGSILSNILLVLGCCFFIGGIRYSEQSFNTTVASTMSSLMTVASASLIIPATLYASLSSATGPVEREKNILILSHGTAIILLILYVMYLYFQLKSHASLFEECTPDAESQDTQVAEEDEHLLNPWAASVALVVVTILVAVCADYLVGSIDNIVEKTGMSRTFIGLILIPIVGNAAEHVTAVVVAWKGKMDLAIGVAIGSSLQIALFVTPFLVILGWILNVGMTLHFHIFETVAFFISGLVVTFLIQDGKSNYLEGGLCLGMYVNLPSPFSLSLVNLSFRYVILALAFYVYPDTATDDALFHA